MARKHTKAAQNHATQTAAEPEPRPATRADGAYGIVTDRILAALATGVPPWRRSWRSAAHKSVHGHEYTGINRLLTAIHAAAMGYQSNVWITYRQAQERGGFVRKGEKGLAIIFVKSYDRRGTDDDTGEETTERRFAMRCYTVFNLDQCDGVELPKRLADEEHDVDSVAAAEAVAASYENGPEIHHNPAGMPCYIPGRDRVEMPRPGQFQNVAAYYAALFHELTHSTGHEKRLNREGIANRQAFGNHAYSREELIAELGAAFLCARVSLERDTEEASASYIAGWLKALKDDPKMVVQCAAAAERAADLILGRAANASETSTVAA